MHIILNNPYRIVGVLSNASERELEKNRSKFSKFLRIGRSPKSDYDFEFLGNINRDEDSFNKAIPKLQQSADKVNFALFWFLNASPFDNTAIEYLRNGNEVKALEIWKKVTIDKEVNSKNFSAFNNIGTYKLLSKDKSEIKSGIEAKIKLIDSDYFQNFVHTVADETCIIDNQRQSEKLIDELLTQFKNHFSFSEIFQFFKGCEENIQKHLSKKITEEPLQNLESQIERCKKKRKADKGSAYEYGLKLFTNSKESLSFLKSFLGTSDLKYKSIADQLSNEIMQCGIDYFNENQNIESSNNYAQLSQKLLKLANSIAIGKLTKDRIIENKTVIDESVETQTIKNELDVITNQLEFLKNRANSIGDAIQFIRICKPELQKIKASIGENELYLNISSTVASSALGFSIFIVNNANENAKRIGLDKMKLLMSDEMTLLEELSNMDMNEGVTENYEINSRTLRKNYNDLKDIGDQTGGSCYIATMAYGDYDHPQVLELRKFRDNFLSKTKLGRNFIKLYYKYSPSLVQRLKNKQDINLVIRKGLDQFIKTIRK